ncbi:hypothetical protein [Streptomyces mutomycini]|uniref:Uncharacterized protein n=1 Tax=Streptomyces mutomycini TaxID=284036 RepID=A0ABW0B7I2_9ACTN|nr:hypothetical protein [Streptomyces mutomycini]
MSADRDDEPVFIRSKWGTSRYVYNPDNPVGLALIIGSLLFAGVFMYVLHDDSSWSDGELHDAVHSAVRTLEDKEQTVGSWAGGYDRLIDDAIQESGEGPSVGGLSVSKAHDAYDRDAPAGVDRFEVAAEDVDTVYCLGVSPQEPEAVLSSVKVTLHITVDEDHC